ncbi:MAG: hypothetical protein KC502_20595 [Myxococcales bacterium]|nr:hypothetical protein [Myxococcales bacterium]
MYRTPQGAVGLASLAALLLTSASLGAQPAPPAPPPPPAPPSAPAPAKTQATGSPAATGSAQPAADSAAASQPGGEAKLQLPELKKGVCPAGATWQTVIDRSPVPRCKLPLQAGCMLKDGRRHGPWTLYDRVAACTTRKEVLTYDKGRRTGPVARFVSTCKAEKTKRTRRKRRRFKGKKASSRCSEQLTEQGAYIDGKGHGMWLMIDKTGRKLGQYQMHTGVKHGPFYFFNSQGVLIGRGCNQEGAETWRFDFHQKERWNDPCQQARKKVKAVVPTGVSAVSTNQAKASKLVRLAQVSKLLKLRVRYLQKAVQLDPANVRYQRLLAAAQAELAAK